MLKQLFSRMNRHHVPGNQRRQRPAAGTNPIERMEDRTLFSTSTPALPVVESFTSDNRGEIQITFNTKMRRATLNARSVTVYTAGKDKKLGTKDDVPVKETISLNKFNVLTIMARVALNQAYRVDLNAKLVKNFWGKALDGEANSSGPSGNGKAGGDFNVQCNPVDLSTDSPVVRFYTGYGDMDVALYGAGSAHPTPKHVAYFLGYVNNGIYDNMLVTRSAPDFVVQMGALNVDKTTDKLGRNPILTPSQPLADEPGNSNVTGTIAFALSGGPATARNEFFFNVEDNTQLDGASSTGGPFTPFGIMDNASLRVLDRINNLDRVDLDSVLGGAGVDVENVPVNSRITVTGETGGSSGIGGSSSDPLDVATDFVLIQRVAVLNNVSAIA